MSNVPSAGEVSVMDTFSAIGTRRSIRWYEPHQPFEKWKVQAILEAARLAPSAGNFNGQRAIVVYRDEDPDVWEFISDWSQITTRMAPVLVFLCYDMANYGTQGQSIHDLMRTGALEVVNNILRWEQPESVRRHRLPAISAGTL